MGLLSWLKKKKTKTVSSVNAYRVGSRVKIRYYYIKGTMGQGIDEIKEGNVVVGKVTDIRVFNAGTKDHMPHRDIVSVKMPDGSTMDYLKGPFDAETLVSVVKY